LRYAVHPTRVEEITLFGTADLSFWRAYLEEEKLEPLVYRERARIMVMGASMTYLGLRYTEISFSVVIALAVGEKTKPAAFLLGAFNSSWLATWSERMLLGAPYRYAECTIASDPDASIALSSNGSEMFRAQMRRESDLAGRPFMASPDADWEGVVFLSGGRCCRKSAGRHFFARLAGNTVAYPFSGRDVVRIADGGAAGLMRALNESGFSGEAWVTCSDAQHGQTMAQDPGCADAAVPEADRGDAVVRS